MLLESGRCPGTSNEASTAAKNNVIELAAWFEQEGYGTMKNTTWMLPAPSITTVASYNNYTTYSSVHHSNLPQDIIPICVLPARYHLEVGIGQGPSLRLRPVFVAPVSPCLLLLGQHDNGGTLLLPNHPPEVFSGVW